MFQTKFFGFDSFEGFGKLSEDDLHPFYIDINFKTDYDKVRSRVKKLSIDDNFSLVKGFFSDTLKHTPKYYNIEKSKIIFMDCDTHSSTKEAFDFCLSTIQKGTFIILDDFFSYKGNKNKGVAKAFNDFLQENNFEVRRVFDYGMGGTVFIVSDL